MRYKNKIKIEDWGEIVNPNFVPLTDEQVAFCQAHPDATPQEVAKENKLCEIQNYDISENVNGFFLNGNLMWLDKATRSSLFNTIDAARLYQQQRIAIWHEGISVDLDVEEAYRLLSALELYANQCYSVTHQHLAAVTAMTNIEEINAFDVSADYPTRLTINTPAV